jgi:hypothetical protein
VAFSSLLALAAVLAEVLVFDMAGLVGQPTREAVLAVVVPAMIALLVLIVPALELRGLVAGWRAERGGRRRKRCADAAVLGALAAWLLVFWTIGEIAPRPVDESGADNGTHTGVVDGLVRACLTRVGIVGITLMALLSGFAAVSTPWHLILSPMFCPSAPSESEIASKQTHLATTAEMLLAKRQRLQTLERKASSTSSSSTSPLMAARAAPGLMGKVMGTIRAVASGDDMERRALRVEIAALETVEANLASKLDSLQARYAERVRAATPLGRVLALPTHVFAVYCLYRICATAVSLASRAIAGFPAASSASSASSPSSSSSPSFSSSDPVSRIVGLVAWHWDPTLDQDAWARQIAFLLSGAMLIASLSSAMQTMRLLSRAVPALILPAFVVRHARASAALIAAQVAATYIVSAALLLRGSLPRELVQQGAMGGVLRGVLDPAWVERWFEGWFFVAGLATVAVIWLGKKLDSRDYDEDDAREREDEFALADKVV